MTQTGDPGDGVEWQRGGGVEVVVVLVGLRVEVWRKVAHLVAVE